MAPQQPDNEKQKPITSKYNGEVSIQGEKVEVKNGVGKIRGEEFYVNDDGSMVVDKRRILLGYIEDGKMKSVDRPYLEELKKKGY